MLAQTLSAGEDILPSNGVASQAVKPVEANGSKGGIVPKQGLMSSNREASWARENGHCQPMGVKEMLSSEQDLLPNNGNAGQGGES